MDNNLNIARIENGQDMRTTVMIKNIPNKMTDKDLMTFIERVCTRRIDFFYLRMDFKNGMFSVCWTAIQLTVAQGVTSGMRL
jgi:RNA recognition motif 2